MISIIFRWNDFIRRNTLKQRKFTFDIFLRLGYYIMDILSNKSYKNQTDYCFQTSFLDITITLIHGRTFVIVGHQIKFSERFEHDICNFLKFYLLQHFQILINIIFHTVASNQNYFKLNLILKTTFYHFFTLLGNTVHQKWLSRTFLFHTITKINVFKWRIIFSLLTRLDKRDTKI